MATDKSTPSDITNHKDESLEAHKELELSLLTIIGAIGIGLVVTSLIVLPIYLLTSIKSPTSSSSSPLLVSQQPSIPAVTVSFPPTNTAENQSTDFEFSRSEDPTFLPIGNNNKLYTQMSQDEKIAFIEQRAQHVSQIISNKPYSLDLDAVLCIKKYLDQYSSRIRNQSSRLWGEDLTSLYVRASQYAPTIIDSFQKYHVPPAVGLYLVVVETEYHECLVSPAGAKGLFQFMPDTARAYGVSPDDRCDVKKMAPAAARYIADRMTEFGTDSMSVSLAIAGYNRSPHSVRRDLLQVLNSENPERSFWTLVINSDKLNRTFQNENVKYVPKFYAAALIGETPLAFDLPIQPLSTYYKHEDISESIVLPSIPQNNQFDDPIDKDMDQKIKRSLSNIARQISSDSNPYEFNDDIVQIVKLKMVQYQNDEAIRRLIIEFNSNKEEIRELALRHNIETGLLLYTALFDSYTHRENILLSAQKALPELQRWKKIIGTQTVDSSLIIVLSYLANVNDKKITNSLLSQMRKYINDPNTQRNVWYLHQRGAIIEEHMQTFLSILSLALLTQQ